MIRAAIIGAESYSAGELFRLLINHPDVEIAWVYADGHAGELVTDVHQGLLGETYLRFTDTPELDDIDILFMCTPKGESRRFLEENAVSEDLRIVDLSPDFRMTDDESDFIYGLPEYNRKPMVRGAKHVASPGHFAIPIELSLLPLAEAGLLKGDIHITGVIGSTETGNILSHMTHSPWRNDNLSVFSPFVHRHLREIKKFISAVQPDYQGRILFVPIRASFPRGLMTVTYMSCDLDIEEIRAMYEDAYIDHNFTFIADRRPDLKDVANTNKCIIYLEKSEGRLVITAVIDNLLKGSAGNALHIMNLLFGLSERTGLSLKPSAF